VNIRFYFDEDTMDADLVEALRVRGVDVQTALDAGMLRREDHELLAYASQQGRAVYTFNIGHFCALNGELLRSGGSHAGIVVCQQQRYSVGEQMRRLLTLVTRLSAEEMQNSPRIPIRLGTRPLTSDRARATLLPVAPRSHSLFPPH